MLKKVVMISSVLLLFGSVAFAAAKSWVGTVSDSNCGAKHAAAGKESAACVAKCVAGGGKYVLVSRGKVYQLEPQDKFPDFAGKRVKVSGTASGETITASSVTAAAAAPKSAKKKPAGM